MADNVSLPLTGAGDTTATVATDQVSSAHYQYVKAAFGADGTATKVSATDPLPVYNPNSAYTAAPPSPGASVTVGSGSTLIMAENATRRGLMLYFEGDTYVAFGASASSSAMLFYAGSYLNMLSGFIYQGDITGMRVGSVDVTVRKVEF